MSPSIRAVPLRIALFVVIFGNSRSGAQTEAPGVIYDSGFFNEERLKDTTWRWMEAEGVVKLKNTGHGMVLKITGRAPVDTSPGEPPTMKIFLNGEQLEQFTPSDKNFEKEYKVSAVKLGERNWNELKMTTTKVIIPSQVNNKSKDDRELGFKLYKLTWLTVAGVPPEPAENPEFAVQDATTSSRGWLAAAAIIGFGIMLSCAIVLGATLYLRLRRGATEPATDEKRKRSGKQQS